MCTWFWLNSTCGTCSCCGTWYWTWGSGLGWGAEVWAAAEASGPGRGEKLGGGSLSGSWRGGEGQSSGASSSGSEGRGDASTRWSDTIWQPLGPSAGPGDDRDSRGTTGSAAASSSELMGELSACCGGRCRLMLEASGRPPQKVHLQSRLTSFWKIPGQSHSSNLGLVTLYKSLKKNNLKLENYRKLSFLLLKMNSPCFIMS